MATQTSSRPAMAATASAGPLATMRALRRDPLRTFTDARREQGLLALLPLPRMTLHLVSDPSAIQDALTRTHHEYEKGFPSGRGDAPARQPLERVLGQGLLTSDAALHRVQRRLIQPLFHHEAIAGYGSTFVDLTGAAIDGWTDGQTRDLHDDMVEITLAIVARTIFDVDLGSRVVDTIRTLLGANQSMFRRDAVPGGRLLDRLPLPSNRRFREAMVSLDAIVYDMLAQRRARGQDGRDLLSLLLAARDGDTGQPMSDRQIRDEALTLLLAGHETTANTLAWTLHLLGTDPAVQERLFDEVDTVLNGRKPAVADLPRLPYTAAVVAESMRLYPPAWTVGRHLAQERVVCGRKLAPGTMLVLSPWVVHRDPMWWPRPERFEPQRWLADPQPPRPRYAYFPFGGGPRQCIGNSFAEMEAALVLATVAQRFRVAPVEGAPPVVPRPQVTLRPRYGVVMSVHGRDSCRQRV
jgi:cytochrome P450